MIRIKICGITNAADALAAIDAGANLLGFNFYEKSPRHIDEAEAAKIRRQLPKKIEAVGIFVNATPADVSSVCESLKLDAAQLHGDESPETVAEVARNFTVWKAFRVDPDFHLKTLDVYAEATAFLFDAAHTGQYGAARRCWPPYHFGRRPERRKRGCGGAHRAPLCGGCCQRGGIKARKERSRTHA